MSDREVDRELVRRVQNGEKEAFDVLVLKYQHKLLKLISRYIRDSSEALDVAQEAFIKAYRAIPNFRNESAFYTWLYRIAINTAKNHVVSLSRRPPGSDVDFSDAELSSAQPDLKDYATPERLLLREEIQNTVADAIAELPEDLKIAITLRELEGLSYEEISQTMECPIGTVRSRIFRAREVINSHLQTLLDETV